MSSEKKQVFHPIGMLPTIATVIREGFVIAQGQTDVLVKCHTKQHPVLSITDIDRIIQQANTSLDHVRCAKEQLERWKDKKSLTGPQRTDVDALLQQIPALTTAFSRMRQLAEDYKPKTLEAFMDKSDLEIGLEAVAGMFENAAAKVMPGNPPLDERLTVVADFITTTLHESDEDLDDLTNRRDCFWKSRATRIKHNYQSARRMAEDFGRYLENLPADLAATRLAKDCLQRMPAVHTQINSVIAACETIERTGPSFEDLKKNAKPAPDFADTLHTLEDIRFTLDHIALVFAACKGALPPSVSDKTHSMIADLEETQDLHDTFMAHWQTLPLSGLQHQERALAEERSASNRASLRALKASMKAH